jgi:hypothetical protein
MNNIFLIILMSIHFGYTPARCESEVELEFETEYNIDYGYIYRNKKTFYPYPAETPEQAHLGFVRFNKDSYYLQIQSGYGDKMIYEAKVGYNFKNISIFAGYSNAEKFISGISFNLF